MPPTDEPNTNGQGHNPKPTTCAVIAELHQTTERLRQIADQLRAREVALDEMETNYPTFKRIAYDQLKKELVDWLPDFPDKPLEVVIREEGALPLDAFIHEIENPRP